MREVVRSGARRVVIDSRSELGLYLAPEFRQDFRESVFRILSSLASPDVPVVVTIGMEMRYAEIDGRLSKVMSVLKVRGSGHSTDLRHSLITEIDRQPMPFQGLLSGHPSAIKTPH
ncbi:KaiC/GvpD/RAD55 family RecA-like ATPase [Oxalobacteraceae bacterium GrIS 1.11]